MHYQIIPTLGPSTTDPDTWNALIALGATSFRLNTSHLTVAESLLWIKRLDAALGPSRSEIVLDLQGSKWRLGTIKSQTIENDAEVLLVFAQDGEYPQLPVPHEDLFSQPVQPGTVVRINDNKVELVVTSVSTDQITCRVSRGGPISSRKGITLPGSPFRREGLMKKDAAIVEHTVGVPKIAYAVSYIKDAREMQALRGSFDEGVRVIAKLERPEAIEDALEISRIVDEVWLCRGDLGAEVGGTEMARQVHLFRQNISNLACPAILAGQVLEHMTSNQEPTRSELCNIYDSLIGGFVGVVLSDETAVGGYPVESCRTAASFR